MTNYMKMAVHLAVAVDAFDESWMLSGTELNLRIFLPTLGDNHVKH